MFSLASPVVGDISGAAFIVHFSGDTGDIDISSDASPAPPSYPYVTDFQFQIQSIAGP